MRVLWHLALREFRAGLRNRWVAATIVILAALALCLAWLGTAPVGATKASPLSATVVSLSSLSVYLLPLIALLLSHDAIVGEQERGTLPLLLSYPVARWQVVLGKFAGHLAILACAVVLGYGSAGLLVGVVAGEGADGAPAFAALCGSSILLGAVFLALGYLLSALADERAKVVGLVIGLWLFLVVLYDLGLLGLLLLDSTQAIAPTAFTALMLANPADAFRIFNLSLFEDVRRVGGLATGADTNGAAALAVMVGWMAAALLAAVAVLSRKEL